MPLVQELAAAPASGGAFASLRHRQFRWMYASNTAFFFAMNGQFVVRSYLAFKLTGSAFSLGIINLAVAVPMLVISPFGGVLADRVEKRNLIMVGQALLLFNELIVLALLVTNRLEFWHLFAVVFLMGCLFPFIMPARQSIVANIVGRQGLGNAMALQMSGMNAARVVGPVTAGLIISVAGVRWVYAVAVALYLLALLAMSRIDRAPPAPATGPRTVFGDIWEGVRYVRSDRPVRVLLLLSIVPMMLAMPFQALLVVFSEEVWHTGSRGLGILQGAAGVGGVLGSVIVAAMGDIRRKLRVMMVSLLAFGGTLLLFAMSPWFLLALPFVLLADVFANVFGTVNATAIQVLIPDEVRGRVMSLMMMTFGLTPLGTLPVSAAAQAFGAPVAVGGAAIVTTLIAVLIYMASPALRGIDETSRAALEAAPPRLPAAAVA
jgi:MFS family permease